MCKLGQYHMLKLLLALTTLCILACSTNPIGRGDLLDFLKDGVTTKEEVILKLGDPKAMYEGSRIITYRLFRDNGGWVQHDPARSARGVLVNLVVVFDSQGVMKRHSVVEIGAR